MMTIFARQPADMLPCRRCPRVGARWRRSSSRATRLAPASRDDAAADVHAIIAISRRHCRRAQRAPPHSRAPLAHFLSAAAAELRCDTRLRAAQFHFSPFLPSQSSMRELLYISMPRAATSHSPDVPISDDNEMGQERLRYELLTPAFRHI